MARWPPQCHSNRPSEKLTLNPLSIMIWIEMKVAKMCKKHSTYCQVWYEVKVRTCKRHRTFCQQQFGMKVSHIKQNRKFCQSIENEKCANQTKLSDIWCEHKTTHVACIRLHILRKISDHFFMVSTTYESKIDIWVSAIIELLCFW